MLEFVVHTTTLDSEAKQRRKSQPHPPALVRDGSSTVRTTHLDGKLTIFTICGIPSPIQFAAVKVQIPKGILLKSNVVFVKYRHPLEGSAVELLATAAVT